MRRRIVELLILAEDHKTAYFLKRYAKRIVAANRIRIIPVPDGEGAGEKWVRDRYPIEVAEQRRGRKLTALVVHVDADTGSVENELRQLEKALAGTSAAKRGDDERIAIVVPKRHTETWIHGLCATDVDEDYDYKRDPDRRVAGNSAARDSATESLSRRAAEELYALTRHNAPSPPASLPSLARAIPELRRLELE